MSMSKKRVLSGMQPSGLLHLGNPHGRPRQLAEAPGPVRVLLLHRRLARPHHELRRHLEDPDATSTRWSSTGSSAGLDPEKSVLFQQSLVPEHAVLHVLLSMSTPLPWLERVPTYKEKMDQIQDKDMNTYGFLGYPVLQAADILIYKAHFVPVGIDQLPHLELTREIGRRFNQFYGEVFPEPQPLMTEYPKLPGTDGRKMSKSYGNYLNLSDSPEEITKKVMAMVTDPARVRRQDPGNPDVCPLFALDKIFAPKEWCDHVNVECRRAGIGCVDDKKELLEAPAGLPQADAGAPEGAGSRSEEDHRDHPGRLPQGPRCRRTDPGGSERGDEAVATYRVTTGWPHKAQRA